jgi:hypothetical protein
MIFTQLPQGSREEPNWNRIYMAGLTKLLGLGRKTLRAFAAEIS